VGVTALRVAGQSRVDDVPVQQLPPGTWHFATRRAALAAGSRYRLLGATLGAGLEKAYWDVLLEGAGAEADVLAVCHARGRQHLDLQSLQLHRARDTRSNLLYKVAARDRAQSVYSGLIDVERDAVHADGYVLNRNLLLSRRVGKAAHRTGYAVVGVSEHTDWSGLERQVEAILQGALSTSPHLSPGLALAGQRRRENRAALRQGRLWQRDAGLAALPPYPFASECGRSGCEQVWRATPDEYEVRTRDGPLIAHEDTGL
jgi:hypothetical protein